MNPFLLDSRSRIAEWKELRARVAEAEDVISKIDATLTFWRKAPIENPIIDWDNSTTWPTAWEMLHSNRFCESALSLGVAYSLLYSDPAAFDDLKLILLTDRQNHVQKIVVRTQQQVLNYGWLDRLSTEVLNTCQVHNRWHWDGRAWQSAI